jgi:HD-GYP domain-containing protein (c-di-GMP phosphodiesterase class II)
VSDAPHSVRSSADDQVLALNLVAAIRTAAYYDADNAVMQQVCSTLGAQLAGRTELGGSVRIGVHSHCVFVGAARVRASVLTIERFGFLTQVFEDWGINSLTFHSGISGRELVNCALVLARERGDRPDELTALLRERGVAHVDVDLLTTGGGGTHAIAPVESYAAAVQVGEKLRASTESAEHADMRLARHVTQAVVDNMLADPRSLLALTTIKEFDNHLVSHSANVAILSVFLGQRLGLSKSRLGELCLAAFLHDAGKLEVSAEVLYKPGPLNSEEWEEMRTHPIIAARALLGARRLSAPSMRAVVVAYEHHLNYDMSGYPPTKTKDHVSLFGNIVTIADRYDALTTTRPYRIKNFTPHEAVSYLIANAGTFFDPILVKLFVEMIGLYPPGTLVSLDNGDLGVVCEPPAVGQPLDRPRVRLLTPGQVGRVVDLGEHLNGTYALSVTLVLNPADQGQVPAMDLSVFETEGEGGTAP